MHLLSGQPNHIGYTRMAYQDLECPVQHNSSAYTTQNSNKAKFSKYSAEDKDTENQADSCYLV